MSLYDLTLKEQAYVCDVSFFFFVFHNVTLIVRFSSRAIFVYEIAQIIISNVSCRTLTANLNTTTILTDAKLIYVNEISEN